MENEQKLLYLNFETALMTALGTGEGLNGRGIVGRILIVIVVPVLLEEIVGISLRSLKILSYPVVQPFQGLVDKFHGKFLSK